MRRSLFVLILLVVLFVSFLPGNYLPSAGSSFSLDKVAHYVIYHFLSFFALWAFGDLIRSRVRSLTLGLCLMLLGFLVELAQLFLVQGREFSFGDLLANLLGVIAGIVSYSMAQRSLYMAECPHEI